MILLNCAQTNVGMRRTENQDSFGVRLENDFFFVCDGMGGGVAGDFASKYAVDVMLSLFEYITKEDSVSILGKQCESFDENVVKPITLIKLANRALNNITRKYPKLSGMGTTCSATWFDKKNNLIHIYNVGDSRVYRVRNGKIQQLTKDHSKIEELIDSGKMTQEDVKTAEIQSMITRALGIGKTVKVDYKFDIVKDGDIYILCTDGLNGELTDSNINDIVNLYKYDVESISKELILAANNLGGRDNTTVISVCSKEDIDSFSTAKFYQQQEILTFGDEISSASAKEDYIIHKYSKKISVPIPKLAKNKNLLKSPILIAIFLVLLCVIGIFSYTSLFNNTTEQKSIVELTGNISGINLDVRTLVNEKLIELSNTKEKVFRMQILQECINNIETFTVPLSNVTVNISMDGQNKFIGLSNYKPLDIKLPRGKYLLKLEYAGYKILDENLKIKDSLDVYFENSKSLSNVVVIMLPEQEIIKEG